MAVGSLAGLTSGKRPSAHPVEKNHIVAHAWPCRRSIATTIRAPQVNYMDCSQASTPKGVRPIQECGLRVFSAYAILLLFLSACDQRTPTPTTTAQAPRPGAESAPPSLSMGGAKSVTRFFVTSRGLGRGGDVGGLAGADAHCQALAKAEGSGDHTWRAYLSAMAMDRVGGQRSGSIGTAGNASGDRVALNLEELHGGKSIDQENAVTERGDPVDSAVAEILTGSRTDGTAFQGTDNLTCGNWTSSSVGHAQVGRLPTAQATDRSSWNSAHPSRGCSQADLQATGGGGLFYCFATD